MPKFVFFEYLHFTWNSHFGVWNVKLGKIWPRRFNWLEKTKLEPKFKVSISKNKDFDQQCNYQKVWKIALLICEPQSIWTEFTLHGFEFGPKKFEITRIFTDFRKKSSIKTMLSGDHTNDIVCYFSTTLGSPHCLMLMWLILILHTLSQETFTIVLPSSCNNLQ